MSDQHPEELSLMALFREEVEQYAEQITQDLIALELGDADPGIYEPLMRAAHSLKGAARVVDIESAVHIAHVMEDAFVSFQSSGKKPDPAQVDCLLGAVDWIRCLAATTDDSVAQWLIDQADQVARLEQQLKQINLPSDTPASPSLTPTTPTPAAVVAPVSDSGALLTRQRTTDVAEPPINRAALKIGAEVLNNFLGLASESLVEAHRFEKLTAEFEQLIHLQQLLDRVFTRLELAGIRSGSAAENSGLLMQDARSLLDKVAHQLRIGMNDLDAFGRRNTQLADRLFQEAISSRMRPFSDIGATFPRMVRDVGRELGKDVQLTILGAATQVDRDILDKLEAPLGHLLRNAIDHGIEHPEQRIAAGKAARGSIRLHARHRDGRLLVTLDDDGAGIARQTVVARILARGLATMDMLQIMSDDEVYSFLFLPGFTTRDAVSEVSGRGVGLDVVQSMVHAEGGSLSVTSQPGEGTRFSLQLPVTRSVVRALLVTIAGEPYAFPLGRIERVLRAPLESIGVTEGRCYLLIDDQPIALITATELLDLPTSAALSRRSGSVSVIVLGEGADVFALEVDDFLGESELVLRPMDARLGKVAHISAVATLEEGAPVLVMDVDDMIRSTNSLLNSGKKLGMYADRETDAGRTRRVLIVDDSVTVRELERRLLEQHGYHVELAVDGAEGWNALRLHDYDLLISDVDMPRMNGLELVRRVRSDARLAALPVIIVSYKERDEDRARGEEVGADIYLTKTGFRDNSLVKAVQQLIGDAFFLNPNHGGKS